MCIKIIRSEQEQEFNVSEPLELQIADAKEIVVNYDPTDSKIDSFVCEIERLAKNGISCRIDIKVNANNDLDGMKLERRIDRLKLKLDMNEVIKGLCNLHANADRRLTEISEMCLGKINEQ